MQDNATVYPSSSSDVLGGFETVMCGHDVQVKQEIIEDDTDNLNTHEAGAEFTTTKPTAVIQKESDIESPTKRLCTGFSENMGKLDLLDPLTRTTKAVSTSSNSPEQITGGNDTTRSSVAADGQIVYSSQPLVKAFTSPNNIEILITNTSTTIDSSATGGPIQPPQDVPFSPIPNVEDLEGVFISLKGVPLERREKTKVKLLDLNSAIVKIIEEADLDPDKVNFSVTMKQSL